MVTWPHCSLPCLQLWPPDGSWAQHMSLAQGGLAHRARQEIEVSLVAMRARSHVLQRIHPVGMGLGAS